ncbi:hypothetical protein ABN763_00715 [Spongiivirga sp. MCCC 1A20706]|uniref:hypothetical protein n=1 Tax=Spongiivirga sp. MCCC 1A20706 TaxID=3160963 RepID=UPI0039776425
MKKSQFCRVGAVKAASDLGWPLADLKRKYQLFWEKSYSMEQTDAGLSDFFAHEAKKALRSLKKYEAATFSI